MSERKEISISGSLMETIVLLSEGNPGAVTVLAQIIKEKGQEGLFVILDLDDMNIRGSQIWIAYSDYCDQDIDKLIQACESRDEQMVELVNKQGRMGNHGHLAVSSGASGGRRQFIQNATGSTI